MENTAEKAVERAILTMHDNLGEPLTIDDMARAAMFSKFHFSRIFRRVTGISPGRFLSALRLQEAKRLLTSTSLNVADISLRVGYNSVGTFSSRFTRSVGMPPTTYRRLGGFDGDIPRDASRDRATGSVQGRVRATGPVPLGLVFLGLFPDPLPEGLPVRCTILNGTGSFRLDDVPEGTWYLMSQSVAGGDAPAVDAALSLDHEVHVATSQPLTVRREQLVQGADLTLSPMRTIDPPVLLALFNARVDALHRGSYDALAA
ncbi:helix-turn-helix domain-containing protein [Actinoplanes teichomyceticus]|uniref:AraC family transcriptional regulator n=1 Tax=Actinoplanes teichomyceticus TaxID=1867 RepID=A0A561WBT6_ACTTI|nr:AraC family transcriptional regulator [Actinoplanes teichomyceticus]TWG21327.1 AraC family transcriptional regulator [Actinoplanes teichomyceticus]GIF16412.1 AraC family transcriptional regulator [Actinoplanes teichomyceticus]